MTRAPVTAAPTPTIAAATVVIVRDAPEGWELLLLERHANTAFAGGAMVFPGGRVDPGDAAVAADPALAVGFASLDATDATGRIAAAREAFEEADVLLASGRAIEPHARARWRAELNAGTADFGAFLRDTRHVLDAAAVVPFAHWVPPAATPMARRFDTRFYLARLPAGAMAAADGHEAVTASWTTPAAALARAAAGAIELLFPTQRNLERLAQYATLDTLVAATAARPVVRIQPAVEQRADGAWLTIPAGCDYPVTGVPLATLRRE